MILHFNCLLGILDFSVTVLPGAFILFKIILIWPLLTFYSLTVIGLSEQLDRVVVRQMIKLICCLLGFSVSFTWIDILLDLISYKLRIPGDRYKIQVQHLE